MNKKLRTILALATLLTLSPAAMAQVKVEEREDILKYY